MCPGYRGYAGSTASERCVPVWSAVTVLGHGWEASLPRAFHGLRVHSAPVAGHRGSVQFGTVMKRWPPASSYGSQVPTCSVLSCVRLGAQAPARRAGACPASAGTAKPAPQAVHRAATFTFHFVKIEVKFMSCKTHYFKVSPSVAFTTFTMGHNRHRYPVPKRLCRPHTPRSRDGLDAPHPPPPPQALAPPSRSPCVASPLRTLRVAAAAARAGPFRLV